MCARMRTHTVTQTHTHTHTHTHTPLSGQVVSIIPGFLSITRKTSLVSSLRLAFGDACAFSIIPLTFKLPDEMDAWAGVCVCACV